MNGYTALFTVYSPVKMCIRDSSLGYQSLDGLLEAIGIDRSKICTYCWTGKE